jgi:nucleotide-binding universal stress UspA family protein
VTGQHAAVGNPAEKILNQTDEMDAGLIVLGSRGLGGIRRPSWAVSPTAWCGTLPARCWWCAKRSDRE